ncbi:MAG: DUF4340 domain-containing protein [Oligoflexia bacterium]|nr:DUF4340 domain-containing protein [Oligoflexia bacterium]
MKNLSFSMILGMALILTSFAGCSESEQELKPGQRAFFFNAASITELELAKADPATSDTWSATAFRKSEHPPIWEIRSAPGRATLADRAANGPFLVHLLDTLVTLTVVEPAPFGPPEGFGLRPPLFAIRVKTGDGTVKELHLGDREPRSGGAYALLPPAKRVYVVRGAALQMLTNLASFEDFRQRTLLAPLISDDIDEVELFRKGRSTFYAQREGDRWLDRKNKRLRGRAAEIGPLLDRLTHFRTESFVDDPEEIGRITAALSKAPLLEAVLTDRAGKATRLKIGEDHTVVVSSRPSAAFRAYPELLGYFEPFQK